MSTLTTLTTATGEIAKSDLDPPKDGRYSLPLIDRHPLELILRRSDNLLTSLQSLTNQLFYPGGGAATLTVSASWKTPHFCAIRHETGGGFQKNLFFLFCTETPVDPRKLAEDLKTLLTNDKTHKVPPFAILRVTLDLPSSGNKALSLSDA